MIRFTSIVSGISHGRFFQESLLANFIKSSLLILCCLIFNSCNELLPGELDSKPKQPVTITDISVDEDPVLQELLSNYVAGGRAVTGRVLSSEVGDIDLSKAVKVENPNLNTTRYSLLLKDDSGAPEFQNYIIKVKNDTVTEYVIDYEPHYSWFLNDSKLGNFTGNVTAYTLEGEIFAENSFLNGEPESSEGGRTEECYSCTITTETSSTTGRDYTVITCEDGSVFHSYSRTACDSGSSSSSDSGGSDSGSSGGTSGGSTSGSTGGTPGGGSSGSSVTKGSNSDNPDNPAEYDENYDPIGVITEEDSRAALEIIIAREQDPETKRKIQLEYIQNFGGNDGRQFKFMIEELLTIRAIKVGFVHDLNQAVAKAYLELKARYIMAIFNPTTVSQILLLSIHADVTGSVRSSMFRTISRYASQAAGQGYSTFNAFKNAHGVAGTNQQWYHIVSQRASNLSKFGASKIHNTRNLVKIEGGFSGSWHSRINSFYLRKNPFDPTTGTRIVTDNLRFGEWVAQKTFQQQLEWGLKVMRWTKGG